MSFTMQTSPNVSPPFRLRFPLWLMLLGPAAIGFSVAYWFSLGQFSAPVRFRVDFSPLLSQPLAVQVHLVSALSAFLFGAYILWAPKGVGLHKPLGWAWVGLMATAAASSFFIKSAMVEGAGGMGPIHALSAWVMIGLPMGIASIRRRDIKSHRRWMGGMFLGGMAIAGLFTFLPGRLMWSLFLTA